MTQKNRTSFMHDPHLDNLFILSRLSLTQLCNCQRTGKSKVDRYSENPYVVAFYFHKNEMFYCVLQFVQKTSR